MGGIPRSDGLEWAITRRTYYDYTGFHPAFRRLHPASSSYPLHRTNALASLTEELASQVGLSEFHFQPLVHPLGRHQPKAFPASSLPGSMPRHFWLAQPPAGSHIRRRTSPVPGVCTDLFVQTEAVTPGNTNLAVQGWILPMLSSQPLRRMLCWP